MRWYLRTYPHLDFGKMPSSLSCVACDEGKSHRASMLPKRTSADPIEASRGDCISVDVKTSTTPGCDNIEYTAVLVSHRTKFVWVLHAATKDLIAGQIRDWFLAYNVRHAADNGPILMFRADNDAALFPADGAAFWASYGVVLSFSAPYTPWHNGTAESFIRSLYLISRTLVRDSDLENYWWPYAVQHGAYLLNRRPTRKSSTTTPFERLFRVPPALSTIPFGCVGHWTPADKHPRNKDQHTFSPRGHSCRFLGFAEGSSTTFVILCQSQVFLTVDVIFPRLGALLITRDLRSGTANAGSAAALETRSEVFDFAAPPLSVSAPKGGNLAGTPLHLRAHDRDCSLCTTRRVGRLLLCCSTCPVVAHLRCAGFRRVPDDEWLCATCTRSPPARVAFAPVLPAAVSPAPAPADASAIPSSMASAHDAATATPAAARLVPAAVVAPGRPSLRSSSRLSAPASPAADAPVRTGQHAPIVAIARVLASVAEIGQSRVLPPALAAAIHDIRRGPLPWVVAGAPVIGVPPAGLRLTLGPRSYSSTRCNPWGSHLGG